MFKTHTFYNCFSYFKKPSSKLTAFSELSFVSSLNESRGFWRWNTQTCSFFSSSMFISQEITRLSSLKKLKTDWHAQKILKESRTDLIKKETRFRFCLRVDLELCSKNVGVNKSKEAGPQACFECMKNEKTSLKSLVSTWQCGVFFVFRHFLHLKNVTF